MSTHDQNETLALLQSLLAQPNVNEILVDGYKRVYVEKNGLFTDIPSPFQNETQLLAVINHILAPLGRTTDEGAPIIDARLADGSKVNIVLPPVSLVGPVLTIRKYDQDPLTIEDLLRFGAWNEVTVEFLRACVQGRLNLIITGGTGSGKTTVMNLIVGMISAEERIITVEETAELQLPETFTRLVRLESWPVNQSGQTEITMQDLVLNAMKMRPDRIIAGETNGSGVLEMIQAMNTGYDGSMMVLHSNGIRDTLSRLETMVAYTNPSLPVLAVRQMMASALDVILHQKQLPDRTRKVLKITEVAGMQGDAIVLNDIFEFRQTGVKDGKIQGKITPTGQIPRFLDRIQATGIELPLSMFTPS